MNEAWPWLTLALLGAYHGLNPAMGWLFAVALGLQEKRLGAVFRALPPLALGHALAVLAAVLVLGLAQVAFDPNVLRFISAGALILFGVYKLVKRKHPRWVGMRVGFKDLTIWSFLMATAHGAGLMLIPVLLGLSPADAHAHGSHAAAPATMLLGRDLVAVGVHTLAMFLVMALVAVVVYKKLGLVILRQAWFNLDLLWAGALIVAGIITLYPVLRHGLGLE